MRILLNRLLIAWWLAPLLYIVGVTFVYLLEGDFKEKHDFGIEMARDVWRGRL